MLKVFCDGSITGSHWAKAGEKDSLPHAWSGWHVSDENGHIAHNSLDLGEDEKHSANVAEYMAVRSALYWLQKNGFTSHALRVYSDSQLIVTQLMGTAQVHNDHLRKFHNNVRGLATLFPLVSYHWISRDKNREADVLSKGIQIWGRVPTWFEVQDYIANPPKRVRRKR